MVEKWHRDGFQGSSEAWTWTRSAWEVAVGTGASSRWPSEVLWDPRRDALLEVLLPWFWVLGCLQPLAWSCFSLLCSLWWRHRPPVGPFLGFIEQLRSVAWGHLSFPTSQWLCRKILCVCVYFNCSHITSCCSSQCNRAFKKKTLVCPHVEPWTTAKSVCFFFSNLKIFPCHRAPGELCALIENGQKLDMENKWTHAHKALGTLLSP